MIIFSNLFVFLAKVFYFLSNPILEIYKWVVIIRALLSWVNPDPYNPIVRFLNKITYPLFTKIRQVFRISFAGGIDFSPLIAVILIYLLQLFLTQFLVPTLYGFAGQFQ